MPIGVYYHKPREQWVKDKIRNTLKGRIPKNFEEMRKKSPIMVIGHPQLNTGRTHFKKGFSIFPAGIKRPDLSNENHWNWKGDNVGYSALHHWISRKMGKATLCTFCNSTIGIQWANKSQQYKRDLTDWIQLCIICHKKYDLEARRQKSATS